MPRLTTRDGDQLHYHDIGHGPVCVLLHGFGMPGFLWLPIILPLTRRWRFVIPDLRGFGGSHRLSFRREDVFVQFADDLEDLLAALDLNEYALAGLSMGACTALQYHADYGFGRVRAYMNIDNPPCITNKEDWPWGLVGDDVEAFQGGLKTLVADMAQIDRSLAFGKLPRALRQRMWGFFAEFSARAMHHRGLKAFCGLARFEPAIRLVAPTANWPIYVDLMRSFTREDLDWRESLRTIDDTPFEVHIGMRSEIYPPAGQERFADYVPQARFVRYPDCGHALMFDAPRVFARNLDAFLGRAYDQ